MKGSTVIEFICGSIFLFVCWLQYNTSFETTAEVLLVMAVFGAFILGIVLMLVAQRSSNDAIIRHEEATASIERERIKLQRAEQQQMTILMRNASAMAKQQVREMLPYYKAQIEAQYAVKQPVEAEEGSFRPLQYEDGDL